MASVNIIQPCSDVSDIIPLYPQQGLYLKPIAKLNISVHLPTLKLPGKAISNWEVMEKLKYWTIPDEFTSIVVSKNTLEFIRFEAEIESRSKLTAVLARLDGRSIKISGFTESLKVRAAEAKCDFPTRHKWDSFFRDAKHMNEMKPGERPDTIHIKNLPCKWFASKTNLNKPNEYILKKSFETFGEVRCVDIPSLDTYRSRMKTNISGIKMFTYHQNVVFEGYVQFKEYVCFVKAMDTLRGMKLIHKQDSKIFSASITVDFDKTKHLSDTLIKKRRNEREQLIAEERAREEEERLKKEKELADIEAEKALKVKEREEKLGRRKMREEKRKLKQLEKLKAKEAEDMNRKIASEERLLLMAQRRLESIRLLSELLKRVEEATLKKQAENKGQRNKREKSKVKGKEVDKYDDPKSFTKKEEELRKKLMKKIKSSDSKNSKDQQSGSSKMLNVAASTGVSGTVSVSLSSSREDVTSLITSSESDMSTDKDDRLKTNKGKKTQPLPDKFRGNRQSRVPWYVRNPDGGMGYNSYHATGYSRHPQRGYFPRGRRGFRWPYYPNTRGRGGFFTPPYIDPMMLDINHQYYKYFHKLTHGRSSKSPSRRSRSYTRSRSRSSSRSSHYTRRYSRSRSYSKSSRSRTRSRSRRRSDRSRSRSRSRSRGHRRSRRSKGITSARSRSTDRVRHISRSGSNSRTKHSQKEKEPKSNTNRTNSRSNSRSNRRVVKSRWDSVEKSTNNSRSNEDGNTLNEMDIKQSSATVLAKDTEVPNKVVEVNDTFDSVDDNGKRSPIRFPSPTHTWSRSQSHSRSLSWEKRKDSKKDDDIDDKNKSKDKDRKKYKKKKHKYKE